MALWSAGARPARDARGGFGEDAGSEPKGGESRMRSASVAIAPKFSAASPESGPFRLEFAAPADARTADEPGAQPLPEGNAAAAPLGDADPLLPGADIVIGLDSEQRLDVLIATRTREAADRVEAARGDLMRDLAALGSEVEAVTVEVRPQRAPDPATVDALSHGSGGTLQDRAGAGSQPDGQQQRQEGQSMREQSAHPAGRGHERRALPPASGPAGPDAAAIPVRVDRYA